VVIDNTSQFRMDPDVPLVVPEVNPQAIAGYTKRTSSPTQLLDHPDGRGAEAAARSGADQARRGGDLPVGLRRRQGRMDELFNQTRGIYVNEPSAHQKFTKQIAFNVIPHIDVFMDDGSTKEEWKMMVETKKILDRDIK
jgi:aspartate-semialdehyde dehydrogenase